MNKKRLGSLSMRHWGLLLAMAVLTIAYANFADSPSLMAAVTTRELPRSKRWVIDSFLLFRHGLNCFHLSGLPKGHKPWEIVCFLKI